MAQLIDDLLDLSRLTRAEMVWRPVDIAALARAVAWRRIRALGGRLLGPATGVLLVATGAYVTAYWATLGFQ